MFADKKRILETFTELACVYSPSKGEEKLAEILVEKLSVLNLNPQRDEFGNIIAILDPMEGIKAPSLFLSAHLDVVEPCEKVKPIIEEDGDDLIVKTSGDTVLGADDKAGIAAILEAITSIIEKDLVHGKVEIIFTLQEENGLFGVKALDETTLTSKFGYVLDHSAPVGHIVNKAPQHDILTFVFKGKASHAGLQPEEGVSAILAASKAIAEMPIGKLDEHTTANVGTISGGVACNIIPDNCKVTCEVRSHDIKTLNKYVEKYVESANEAVKTMPGTSVTFLRDTEYRNINISQDEDVLKYAKIAAEKLGLEYKLIETCGGSDANVFNYKGMKTVCLGCGYNDPHATTESITLSELVRGADFAVSIIQSVISKNEE